MRPMRKGCVQSIGVCVLGILFSATALSAQIILEQQQAGPSTPVQKKKPAQDESVETLKVNVNVVNVLFNVKDKHGALLSTLTKDDFEVVEDGAPQKIKYFSAESNLP